MSNMNFAGSNLPTRTIPSASTDRGYVLWSLIRQGSQTAEQLRASTSILGVQSRISELISVHYLPVFTSPATKTRHTGRVVPIVRYHLNFHVLDMQSTEWVDFLAQGDWLYS